MRAKVRNLLSVDWDFFFPVPNISGGPLWQLYDWGHREAPWFIRDAWQHRALGFLRNNLPLPSLSGEEKTFWSRFQFRRGAQLYTAESHCMAVRKDWKTSVNQIWSFDAHHDLGYKPDDVSSAINGRFYCHNWLLAYVLLGAQSRVLYPAWKTQAFEDEPELLDTLTRCGAAVTREYDRPSDAIPVVFDAVFVCRSGAWVPTWCDADYQEFIDACPLRKTELQPLAERKFDLDAAQADARVSEQLMALLARRQNV